MMSTRRLWQGVDGIRSAGAVGPGALYRGAGLQRPQYRDRGDRGADEVGRDIGRDAGETQNSDVEHLPGHATMPAPRSNTTLISNSAMPWIGLVVTPGALKAVSAVRAYETEAGS
jgi:hypothetical protein